MARYNKYKIDHFYSYDNGVFKINNKNYDKKSKNELFEKVNNEMNNMNTFLINSTYDIFKNKIYAFIELIEESKKAIYYLNKKNYFYLFITNNDSYPLNYEEELFFPFLGNNYILNYNFIIGHIKKTLIKALGDRSSSLLIFSFSFSSCVPFSSSVSFSL